MIAPARVAAYQIGRSVSTERSTLSDALAAARSRLTDDRDKSLAAEIAIGVQRWRAALDHVIAHNSKRAISNLDDEVLEILRLSAYQLLYLTRVPASAVVDDAVNLTGRVGKRSASGLVNAVLRAISRNRHRIHSATNPLLPARPSDPANREAALDYFAITLSHPRWLVERWYSRYGFDATERWLLFNNTPGPLTLRANRPRHSVDDVIDKLARDHIVVAPGRFAPDALVVQSGTVFNPRDLEEGWYVVQDEASQLVARLAGATTGRRVLDTCAAPGGKTTALAARMPPDGLLIACDIRDRRLDLLVHTVRASGAPNIRIVQADVLQPLPFDRSFDSVFVDAPCSGLGTLRRDPDIKWRRGEADVTRLAAAELRMLRNASATVRAGGRLIYATCSSEPDENESVVTAFLSAAPDFVNVDARRAGPELSSEVVDANGHLRTYPHLHGLEAFFGAVFERTGRASEL